jgi:hypothetical protein
MHVVSGNIVNGKAAYEDFRTLWKGAHPDIPILKEAKRSTGSCSNPLLR